MSKTQQLITEHIDIWTSAILAKSGIGRGSNKKRELYGIKKLRELIFELAVRGKLVPQDSTDEPASALLERIALEKAIWVKEKKIARKKPLPSIAEDDQPFELPNGWSWLRLGDSGNIFNGNSVNAQVKEIKYTNVVNGLPFIATKDVNYGFESFDYENGVSIPRGEPKFKIAHQNAVLVCAEGGSAGKKCGIAEQDICFGNKLFANELHTGIHSRFILANYLSPSFFSQFSNLMTGIIGGISSAKFSLLVIALPPEKEQHRIVQKVDELMLLCDQLEQQTEASIDAHGILVETLLTTLTNSVDADELAENWARISEHFDILFTTDKSIDALKQTILQLAVMGKLVPQNPEDEPASVLLEKISDERTKLIKENKIKKEKPLLSVTDEEKPFELPNGWVWQRIGNTCLVVGGIQKQPKRRPILNHYPYLRVANVQRGFISTAELERFELSKTELEKWSLQQGDLLIVEGNGSAEEIGRCAIWSGDVEDCVYQNHLIRVRQLNVQMEQFLAKYLNSPSGIEIMKRMAVTTSGLYNLSVGKIRTIIFPLPPLDEQHRIVKKVEELMTICDQLKDKLQKSQQTQVHLTDALVDSALA